MKFNKNLLVFISFFLIFNLVGCSKSEIKGDNISEETDDADILSYKIDRLDITNKIVPTDITDNYITYYPEDDKNVLLDLVLEITNESDTSITVNEEYISAVFSMDSNEYTTNVIAEEEGLSDLSSWVDLAPKKSTFVHIYTELKENKITDKILCNLKINDKEKKLNLDRKALAPSKNYINYGEILEKKDFATITFNETVVTKKLVPDDMSGFYTYYEVDDYNDTYLALKMTIKNTSGSSFELNKLISCFATVNDKYEYSGFIVAEKTDKTGFNAYEDLESLKETTAYYLIQIPDEIIESPAEFKINVFSENYYLKK